MTDDDDKPEGGSGDGDSATMTLHVGGRAIKVRSQPTIAQMVASALEDFSANVLDGSPTEAVPDRFQVSRPETEAPQVETNGPVLKQEDDKPTHIAWDDIAADFSEGKFAPRGKDAEAYEMAFRAEAAKQDALVRAEAWRQHLEELSGEI